MDLISAIIYLAIFGVICWGVLAILKSTGVVIPAPILTIIYVIIAVVCLLFLLQLTQGHHPVLR